MVFGILEPELKPAYERKIEKILKKGKFIKVTNFIERYGLE